MGPPILGCSLEQEYGVITEVSNKQSHNERCQMAIEDFDKRHEDGGPRKSFLEGRQSSKFGGYCRSYPTIRRDQGKDSPRKRSRLFLILLQTIKD
jgi:hypothetical protein